MGGQVWGQVREWTGVGDRWKRTDVGNRLWRRVGNTSLEEQVGGQPWREGHERSMSE